MNKREAKKLRVLDIVRFRKDNVEELVRGVVAVKPIEVTFDELNKAHPWFHLSSHLVMPVMHLDEGAESGETLSYINHFQIHEKDGRMGEDAKIEGIKE